MAGKQIEMGELGKIIEQIANDPKAGELLYGKKKDDTEPVEDGSDFLEAPPEDDSEPVEDGSNFLVGENGESAKSIHDMAEQRKGKKHPPKSNALLKILEELKRITMGKD